MKALDYKTDKIQALAMSLPFEYDSKRKKKKSRNQHFHQILALWLDHTHHVHH